MIDGIAMNAPSSKRIVLIDDEPAVVSALKLLLQALGHSAEPFTDPRVALETLPALKDIDVLLCDLRMPGMTGIEVLRCAHASHPHIPFVLMSAHATDKDVTEARNLGAVGYLSKPFTPEQLTRMLSDMASHPQGEFRSW